MVETRYSGPYRYALLGLLTELVTFGLFLLLMAALALAAAWAG